MELESLYVNNSSLPKNCLEIPKSILKPSFFKRSQSPGSTDKLLDILQTHHSLSILNPLQPLLEEFPDDYQSACEAIDPLLKKMMQPHVELSTSSKGGLYRLYPQLDQRTNRRYLWFGKIASVLTNYHHSMNNPGPEIALGNIRDASDGRVEILIELTGQEAHVAIDGAFKAYKQAFLEDPSYSRLKEFFKNVNDEILERMVVGQSALYNVERFSRKSFERRLDQQLSAIENQFNAETRAYKLV